MKKKAKRWQIRPATMFFFVLLAMNVFGGLPIAAQYSIPITGIIIYLFLKFKGHIKPFKITDMLIIMLIFTVWIALGFLGLAYFVKLAPWWKLIIVGMAADIVASVLGTVPVIGDAISAVINMIIAILLLGPLGGAIGFLFMIISLIPGPSMGMITASLIVLKLVVGFL